jgi:hypothetical protein
MPLNIPGRVVVSVAGTPISIYDTIKAANPTDTTFLFKTFHAVLFQALKANTGAVYIGKLGMVKATEAGVSACLAIPTANAIPSYGIANQLEPAGVDLSALYLDADVSGEGVLVTLLVS